jgi:hypothetical protein
MPENRMKLPLGATPGKLVLIAALGVVFCGVLLFQFGGMFLAAGPSPAQPPSGAASVDREEPVVQTSTTGESAPAGRPAPRAEWTRVDLREALAHDPFAVSPALALLLGPEPEAPETQSIQLDEAEQVRAARLQETLGMLRTHGVSMILDDGRGPMATVGDRTLRVGDEIGGFRVVDITVQDGIVLEAVEEEK